MKKWIILKVCILSILTLSAFTSKTYPYYFQNNTEYNDITAVFDKNTTEKELEDLKAYFAKNDIEFIIDRLKYNESNEITGLSITLKKGTTKSKYSASSTSPIPDIELGFKNGNLYITNSGMFDIDSWKNQSNFSGPNAAMDSIFNGQHFAFSFDDMDNSMFFNGEHMDIDQLRDQILKSFQFMGDEDGSFNFNKQQSSPKRNHSKKFNFINDPDIEKLIIIDGEESDFETLNELAILDGLEAVDFLKSDTAISIYGEKAKDGAIIATTKK
ncbi:hypothetical protein GCM10022393_10550 [Aquimarina addita]|uniref:TonB-dependent receptor plug domain-containing protein n=1 Tax=Aquimarina addita TaxID=870485 RepID=A0ABP7XD49_9FLAO